MSQWESLFDQAVSIINQANSSTIRKSFHVRNDIQRYRALIPAVSEIMLFDGATAVAAASPERE